jgi:hypothetical protein
MQQAHELMQGWHNASCFCRIGLGKLLHQVSWLKLTTQLNTAWQGDLTIKPKKKGNLLQMALG